MNINSFTPKAFAAALLLLVSLITSAQPREAIHDSLSSKILNETRELRVILPGTVKDGDSTRYEVVYICDGEWYQDLVPDTYNFAGSAGYAPKAIFVLMRNRYINGRNMRDRDFSPISVGDSVTGGADRFYDFVTTEVVPYIEKKYPASGQRTLVGSSFSGLFTVYAFVKDPTFFHSFVASDPNIVFGNEHTTMLAAKRLPQMAANSGSLFIAGLPTTYRGMGIYGFDSVLQKNAPAHLKWKTVAYDNESHYSVQLKAFYDGFRFAHFGYGNSAPEYHPAGGTIAPGKSFIVYSLNSNPSARVTADGTQPMNSSPLLRRDTSIVIKAPATVRVKTFGNRPQYSNEWESVYVEGKIAPPAKQKKKIAPLTYQFFEGSWEKLPVEAPAGKPQASGSIDSSFAMSAITANRKGYIVAEGALDIPSDGEYVFYANGFDEISLNVGGRALLNKYNDGGNPNASYIISLARGTYPMQLKLLHNNPDFEPHFNMFKCNSESDKWWNNVVMRF